MYFIKRTAIKGQVFLISEEKVGSHPVVQILMPEMRARQIVEALALCNKLANGFIPSGAGVEVNKLKLTANKILSLDKKTA